jgi:hypothetical protein
MVNNWSNNAQKMKQPGLFNKSKNCQNVLLLAITMDVLFSKTSDIASFPGEHS